MSLNFIKNSLLTCTLLSASLARAQSTISTPTGQTLKMLSDTVFVTGHVRVNGGILKLNNFKFLSTVGVRNVFVGVSGNMTTTASNNTVVGANAGLALTTGTHNDFWGANAGKATTTGRYNVFGGTGSGVVNSTGSFNTFVGNSAGNQNTTGSYNLALGNEAGSLNTTGSYNTFVGRGSGIANTSGQFNTYIGYGAGGNATGSNNVFIGLLTGQNEMASNKLYIANSNTPTPLIYGDFSTARLSFYGKTAINTANFPTTAGGGDISGYYLFVKGGILTEAIATQSGWADYVFDENYKLRPLKAVERFIQGNGHLPGIPSAKEIEDHGAELGSLARMQQEKIEELTLYAIEQQKNLNKQKEAIMAQQQELIELKQLLSAKSASNIQNTVDQKRN